MKLSDLIKKIVLDVLDVYKPTELMLGTVKQSKPLIVEVRPGLEISEDFFVISEKLTRHQRTVSIKHSPGAVRHLGDKSATDSTSPHQESFSYDYVEGQFHDVLKKDDQVLILRFRGGHQFAILDRYVKASDMYEFTRHFDNNNG